MDVRIGVLQQIISTLQLFLTHLAESEFFNSSLIVIYVVQ